MDQAAQNDKAIAGFQAKLTKHLGAGISPLIVQAIIAALSAILSGCVAPTPASLVAQIDRPLVQVKLLRQLLLHGIKIGMVGTAQDAATNSVKESSDEELKALVNANEE